MLGLGCQLNISGIFQLIAPMCICGARSIPMLRAAMPVDERQSRAITGATQELGSKNHTEKWEQKGESGRDGEVPSSSSGSITWDATSLSYLTLEAIQLWFPHLG